MKTQARVLVVDDDPVVAKSIDRVLTGKGYAVITARDGAEALEKLASEAYDAVFADIRMPGMDGLEMTARIKATQPWLPVVIVTGYGSPASEARAKQIGVAGFLHKPLSPEEIEGSARDAVQWKPQAGPVAGPGQTAKDVGLFLAAPFIGLAYTVAFPFVGLALLARYGYRALVKTARRR